MRTNDFCPLEHSVLFALKSEISDRYDPTPTFLKRVDRALIVGKNRSGISPLVPENELYKDWSILRKYRKSLNLTIFANRAAQPRTLMMIPPRQISAAALGLPPQGRTDKRGSLCGLDNCKQNPHICRPSFR